MSKVEELRASSPRPALVEMDWPTAQQALLDGQKIRRLAWSDPQLCVFIAMFEEEYLVHRKGDGTLDKLLLRGVDLRATDWVVVREN